MGAMTVLRALLVWVVLLLLAIANGVLREAVLIPRLGGPSGLVLSGLLLSALILVLAWWLLPWIGVRGHGPLLLTGLVCGAAARWPNCWPPIGSRAATCGRWCCW